jgi:hypothetical protein
LIAADVHAINIAFVALVFVALLVLAFEDLFLGYVDAFAMPLFGLVYFTKVDLFVTFDYFELLAFE